MTSSDQGFGKQLRDRKHQVPKSPYSRPVATPRAGAAVETSNGEAPRSESRGARLGSLLSTVATTPLRAAVSLINKVGLITPILVWKVDKMDKWQ
jgi:hypothetical protein